MTRLRACIVLLFCATAICASAQTFTTLVDFDGPNGGLPFPPLIQGTDSNLYGTTFYGGTGCSSSGCGTVFKVTPGGALTTIYNFCNQPNCSDGSGPEAGLFLGTDGNFYGTTFSGGAPGLYGTIFSVTPEGALTTIYQFCSQPNCTDGAYPATAPIQASDGNFYGLTQGGGANGYGTIYGITPSGKLTTLHSFCSEGGCTDGETPIASLVQGSDGAFYGTAYGGLYGAGTIYMATASGGFSTVYNFCSQGSSNYCPDGSDPGDGALIQASDGALYGTTVGGGDAGNGTAYRITTGGLITTLASFCQGLPPNCPNGGNPMWGLIEASDGNFYGTNNRGGANHLDGGVVFEFQRWRLNSLHSFCSEPECGDGKFPGGLVETTNGSLYGVTNRDGTGRYGTVYKMSLGLPPFVETVPTASKARARMIILGNGLTGSTAVSFNGVAAPFTVVSDTEITTRVPATATSGFVAVTTPDGVLTSNKEFRVIP